MFLNMTKKSTVKFKIESGIPIASRKWAKSSIHEETLKKMNKGQSVYWNGGTSHEASNIFGRIAKTLGMKVTLRKQNGGVRIWRVK